MLDSAKPSESKDKQAFVFDQHLNGLISLIEPEINKKSELVQKQVTPNAAALQAFQQSLKSIPRDLFNLKAQAKICLKTLVLDENSCDFIFAFSQYLDHELTLVECFVSKFEELTQNYLKEKRGWYDAALTLPPLLAQCRAQKDLTLLKSTVVDFCVNKLIAYGRQSKTFKPSLEAIANSIPTNEVVAAISSSLTHQMALTINQLLKSSQETMALLSSQLSAVTLEKEKTAASLREVTAKVAVPAKKEPGFFESLFGGDDEEEKSAKPILHTRNAAAKMPAGAKVPAKAPAVLSTTTVPPALRMEEKNKVIQSPGNK